MSAYNLRHKFSEAVGRESDSMENLFQACFDLNDGQKIMLT